MKALSYIILFIVAVFMQSCVEENIEIKKNITPFLIKRSLTNSSNNLNTNDTLEIKFDLSACALRQYSNLQIIKLDEVIKLNVTNTGDLSDTSLNKKYKITEFKLDSILTNELIKDLKVNESIMYQESPKFSDCIISYKDDSIFLIGAENLTAKLKFISKFNLIMKKEFPDSSVFNQLPMPRMIEPKD